MVGISDLKGFIGANTSPAAKATSAIVSLFVLYAIFQNLLPSYRSYLFLFLVWHLLNHFYAGLSENKKEVCGKCGTTLKVVGHRFEKHKCKG